MNYLVYKTTNIKNGKTYIGYHATNNINDDYLGSGKYLLRAIKKYGREFFEKEILQVFDDKESALLKEAELVNVDFINREDTYNFKLGGEGGWNHISKLIKEDSTFKERLSVKISEGVKRAYKEGKIKGWPCNKKGRFSGSKRSLETKMKLSASLSMPKEQIEQRIQLILNSNIDFSKFGWVQKVSTLFKITPQKVNGWMKKYMPEFYNNKCFKRK